MDILSKSNATIEQARKWATDRKATDIFVALADHYYKLCNEMGINFEVAYCQFAKETGYGRFGGVLNESFCNPCGLKNKSGGGDKDPNAHHRFSYWKDGVVAHLQHLALYAGKEGYPLVNPLDPRHFDFLLGKCKTVESLGGSWCHNPQYGNDIIRMVQELENTKVEERMVNTEVVDSLNKENENLTKQLSVEMDKNKNLTKSIISANAKNTILQNKINEYEKLKDLLRNFLK